MKMRVLYALLPALLLGFQNDVIAAPKTSAGGGIRALTYRNVIAFFHEALSRPPTRLDARCAIFSEGEWTNANMYNQSVIMVENGDEDLEIIFIMTGDEGMNWVNEFFDSPFFERNETEFLFGFLNRSPGTHRGKLQRYQVELSRWQPRHHEIVVVSLTPKSG